MMPEYIDIECKSISEGLSSILDCARGDLERKILDIDSDLKMGQNLELALRLERSLSQYINRRKELLYVGLLGHFSSGKSSTINSILEIQKDQRDAREVDLAPTDKNITLITNPINENSFLRLFSYGAIPVSVKFIDKDILKNVVLVDTPGSGDTDPLLVNELMQDFLPICDLVLYFFSAPSALDENDLPLLRAKESQLSLIPIKYVVTRADEFRNNPNIPLSFTNFNASNADNFLEKMVTRLQTAISGTPVVVDDFFLIDNKTQFQVDALRKFIAEQSISNDFDKSNKIQQYKVVLYRKNAFRIQKTFSDFIDEKLKTLEEFLKEANNNIERFDSKVNINKLAEFWRKQADDLELVKNKNLQDLKSKVQPIPMDVWNSETIGAWRNNIERQKQIILPALTNDIQSELHEQIVQQLRTIRDQIEGQIDGADLSKNGPHLSLLSVNIQVGSLPSLTYPRALKLVLENFYDECYSTIELVRKNLEDQTQFMAEKTSALSPKKQFDKIVDESLGRLYSDIDIYFESVILYRSGVFAQHVKQYLSKLGIGGELDRLEKDFDDTFKEKKKAEAKNLLFPDIDNTYQVFINQVNLFKSSVRDIDQKLQKIYIQRQITQEIPTQDLMSKNSPQIIAAINDSFNIRAGVKTREIIGALNTKLNENASRFAKERHQSRIIFFKRISKAAGIIFIILLALLGLSIIGKVHNNPNNTAFVIAIIANIITGIAFLLFGRLAKVEDRGLNKKHSTVILTIKNECKVELRLAFKDIENDDSEKALISNYIGETISNEIKSINTAYQSSTLKTIYGELFDISSSINVLTNNYTESVQSLFAQFSKFYQYDENKIISISQNIKQEAIEPSFIFLEELRKRILSVKERLGKISFISR